MKKNVKRMPWYYEDGYIKDIAGDRVAKMNVSGIAEDDDENAAIILRAVKSHAALVEALLEVRGLLSTQTTAFGVRRGKEIIDAALLAAGAAV